MSLWSPCARPVPTHGAGEARVRRAGGRGAGVDRRAHRRRVGRVRRAARTLSPAAPPRSGRLARRAAGVARGSVRLPLTGPRRPLARAAMSAGPPRPPISPSEDSSAVARCPSLFPSFRSPRESPAPSPCAGPRTRRISPSHPKRSATGRLAEAALHTGYTSEGERGGARGKTVERRTACPRDSCALSYPLVPTPDYLPKLRVAGSSPVARSLVARGRIGGRLRRLCAGPAGSCCPRGRGRRRRCRRAARSAPPGTRLPSP